MCNPQKYDLFLQNLTWKMQQIRGEHALGPPIMARAFGARNLPPPETMTLATPLKTTSISYGL